MKKLLCVLMFGMVFGQDAITTKEITISEDGNIEMIDIGNYVDLVSGFYYVKLIYANLIDTECDFWSFKSYGLSGAGFFDIMSDDGEAQPFLYGINGNNVTINYENSTLDSDGYYEDEQDDFLIHSSPDNCEINLELILRVSGRFDDTDVGLNGDMNDDGTLDVLDVVSLVQEILSGGMGDVGDLLNIVRG